MAEKKLRAIIESQFDKRGTDQAKRSFGDVVKSEEDMATGAEKAARAQGKMGSSIKGATGEILGAVGLAFGLAEVTRKTIQFAQESINAASDLNETYNKVGEVFGTATDQVEGFAKTADVALGQSERQALDAASTFGVFGKSAGLAGQELGDFSIKLTSLASDLASFYNTSPEDAIVAIGAALRGESEPIRRYGVLLDDATLRQAAFEMGIIETTKNALTPQQRVLAAYQVILKQTAVAQGDFARTSDGLANSTRIQAAEMENLKAAIGQGLLPIQLKLTRVEADAIKTLNLLVTWNERLKESLIEHEKEVRDTANTYQEYTDELLRAAGVADLTIDTNGDLVRITNKWGQEVKQVVRENYALSDAQWEVQHSGIAVYEAMREQQSAMQGAAADTGEAEDAAAEYAQQLLDLKRASEEAAEAARQAAQDMVDAFFDVDINVGDLAAKMFDIVAFKEAGGESLETYVNTVKQGLATNRITPEQAQEFFKNIAVEAAAIEVDIGNIDVEEAAKKISEQFNIPLEEAKGLLEDVRGGMDLINASDISNAIRQVDSLQEKKDRLVEPEDIEFNADPGNFAYTRISALDEKIRELEGVHYINFVITQTGSLDIESPVPPGKQHGGPVRAGEAYLVGERGPEIFVPPTGGMVLPNNQIGAGAGVPVGGGNTYYRVNQIFNDEGAAALGLAVVFTENRRNRNAWMGG